MSTPFGPRLIGEAEKTLNALLDKFLGGTALTEPQWVTLRVADALDGTVDAAGVAAAVADQAHFVDAADLVAKLTSRGLLADGRPTAAGRELISTVQARITAETAPIFNDLPAEDVEATTRVLNEVITRARTVLR
jgi:hypothetical protein